MRKVYLITILLSYLALQNCIEKEVSQEPFLEKRTNLENNLIKEMTLPDAPSPKEIMPKENLIENKQYEELSNLEDNHEKVQKETKNEQSLTMDTPPDDARTSMPFPPNCSANVKTCPSHPSHFLFSLKVKPLSNAFALRWTGIFEDFIVLTFVSTLSNSNYKTTTDRAEIYVYNKNGTFVWSKKSSLGRFVIPTITQSGVYIEVKPLPEPINGTNEKRTVVYGCDLKTGAVIWNIVVPNQTFQKPSTRDDIIYLADTELWAVEARTGKIIWKKNLLETTPRSPAPGTTPLSFESPYFGPTINGNFIFAFSREYRLFKFTRSGSKIWQSDLLSGGLGSIIIGKTENLYIVIGSQLWALTTDGKIRWKYTTPLSLGIFHVTIDKNENLYLNGRFNTVCLKENGSILWDMKNKNPNNSDIYTFPTSPPLHDGSRHIYGMLVRPFSIFDDQGILQETYFGYPPENKIDYMSDPFVSVTPIMMALKPSNHLLAFIRDVTTDPTNHEYVFFSVDLGLNNIDGYWPYPWADPQSSNSVP